MCENYIGLILILPLLHCDCAEFLRVTAKSGTALKSQYCAEQSKVIHFSLSTSLFLILNKEAALEYLHPLFLSVITHVPL